MCSPGDFQVPSAPTPTNAPPSMRPAPPGFVAKSSANGLLAYDGPSQPTHPICSCVFFVDGSVGGPTLVTDQRLGGPFAKRGWLVYPPPPLSRAHIAAATAATPGLKGYRCIPHSYPKTNRFVAFDGNFLHGVIPGRAAPPKPACTASAAKARRCERRPADHAASRL
jgi:hypothetical protein